MTRREYRLEYGSFYWYEDDRMQSMCDQIAFVFDQRDGALYKHGRPERMEAWAAEQRAKLEGLTGDDGEPLFKLAILTFNRDFPLAEINRCIDTTGYLKTVLLRFARAVPPPSLNAAGDPSPYVFPPYMPAELAPAHHESSYRYPNPTPRFTTKELPMSTDPTTSTPETAQAAAIEWPEKHKAHEQDGHFRSLTDHELGNWRPAREGEQTFRTCDYCGSMEPRALFEAMQAYPALRLELADMKYGFPHKFYVHGLPHPQGGTQHGGFDGNGSPVSEPRDQHGKFYTVHLADLENAAFNALTDLIAQRTNIRFKRDARGIAYGPEIVVNAPGGAGSPAS
jgi:hypothetical protein